MDIFTYTVDQLLALEEDPALQLDQFNCDVAWKLGNHARSFAMEKYPGKAIVIDVALTSGHVLFRTTTGSGTAYDNDQWVQRKKNVVNRIGKSSFLVGQKLRLTNRTTEEALLISSMEFAAHGGCVPLRLKSFDSMIGTLTISGLKQDQDHLLALDILKSFEA